MEKLAINGGSKIRNKPFPAYKVINSKEIKAVEKVLKSGILSKFLGSWDPGFYGGPQIKAVEKEWARYFKVKHAISVNSCTSGLYCAVGACGIGPGDEVIVSPCTMSASATSILVFNAIPVFADIEEDYFCLDPKSVEKRITKYTKAILVVDIYGQPYDREKINALAKKHNLYIIEDCAQAIGATYREEYAGTLGDIGVFSLNYHKHIHTGEGGMVVTSNDKLAERIRLIRNHAEAVVGKMGVNNLVNMIGFNFRMTEIEAAIARCQLLKLKNLLKKRTSNANYIAEKLKSLPGIIPPALRRGCSNVYYIQCFKYDENIVGISRNKFINAVKAELAPTKGREREGILIAARGGKPLYLQPIYQKMIAYGKKGCPFKCPWYKGKPNYKKGICPVAEDLNNKQLFQLDLIHASMEKKDLDDVIKAFEKVYKLRKTIK
ncbi:DegT/DnrJ/EryC1/StrS family aminotransferase [Candidatus Beckwithbacteria bacterium CG10_big_fil_rev_8_21_14_0_10_34_10]|uniref:DegT/DnrJ/EryC1/StrS family aminotransferase n=1 Tax=Candidatus Beckwithbacteria bacterium CG10_big_fil_rev_8_21_14_0_10_34_10 TaxID=1974495 RepID=A0A2H0WBC5_9BACT|nr:MAG: DegT/DnrJ/EryC1/StrS family aminotransferase [Candidatus Beckwithbacteria bacterium CG10_big_fil_rev_8_21_14_0_10_34_10]